MSTDTVVATVPLKSLQSLGFAPLTLTLEESMSTKHTLCGAMALLGLTLGLPAITFASTNLYAASMNQQESNRDLVQRLFDYAWNTDSIVSYGEFLAPDIQVHGPEMGREEYGLERCQDLDRALFQAFEKRSFSISNIFAHDDKVVVFWDATLFHKADLTLVVEEVIPATYKEVTLGGISIYRCSENKICEIWQGFDLVGLCQSLRKAADMQQLSRLQDTPNAPLYVQNAHLLSPRERECLALLLEGQTAKESAFELDLSHRTVESYLESAKTKLGCANKRELFTAAQLLSRLKYL